MKRLPQPILLALPLLAGGIFVTWWVRSVGGQTLLRGVLGARIPFVLLAVSLTAVWLLVRFIRWQFLLRRVGVRLPIRPTLHSYIAGLPGTATPAYVGEAIRGVFLKRRLGVPIRISLAVLVLERLYDIAVLAVLAIATAPGNAAPSGATSIRVGAAFFAAAILVAVCLWPTGSRIGISAGAMARLRAPSSVAISFTLSLIAWTLASLLLSVAARALGIVIGPAEGARIFATSTLLGAVTLLPAGVGVTGSLAIAELTRTGLTVETAVIVVSLFRLTSTGAALAVGMIFLLRELRFGTAAAVPEGAAHFDAIADDYNAQWSPHVWDLLIERKIGFMTGALPMPPAAAGFGLDLGCGLGLQTAALRERGYRVIGLDPSVGLLASGQKRIGPTPVLAGSALELPFGDASLDFVYTIGVLHHLPGREAQQSAFREISRVLKPGGRLLVHESNPRNPLFRFYMGYLFPILKSIDEGTEWWIDPRSWQSLGHLDLESIRYFTFLPDFTPRALMRVALKLERVLERGPTRPYSAHYMATLRIPVADAAANLPIGILSGNSRLVAT